MSACWISYMKFWLCSRSWKLSVVREELLSKMHFANCAAIATALFTTLIENLRFVFCWGKDYS